MKNASNLAILAVLFIGLACSCPSRLGDLASDEPRSTPSETPRPSNSPRREVEEPEPEYSLTKAKFDKIKVGMARSDVENTLGGKGTEISSSTGGGVRFSVNKWEGEEYRSIIISFRNDKVMTKSQVGLK